MKNFYKHLNFNPNFANFSILLVLVAIFLFQAMFALVHSLINFCKSRKNQVIQINLPAVQEASFPLNNQAFNEDVATFKEFLVLSIFISGIVIGRFFTPKLLVLSDVLGIDVSKIWIVLTFCRRFLLTLFFLFIAFIFYIRNSKLRIFAWKFSCCKCNES